MFGAIREAWAGLDKNGRAVVAVVGMIVVGVLLWFAMAWGYDLTWIPQVLTQE